MSSNNKNYDDITAENWSEICDDSILELLDEPFEPNKTALRTDENYEGFDNNSGDTWIYPTNFPIRTYQYNIVMSALFRNTLVVLPTGLGKTFIAAVVMFNIYRWYPTCKVLFMAPTRPLVAQQIEACCKIMAIPREDTIELTGKINKKIRSKHWKSKRVFFATPQVVRSDIADPEIEFPFSKIKLVVIDEAHKAKGRYAYNEVTRSIWNRNRYFRVLALSATPGRRIEDVVEIIRNLFISCVEVRCEKSIDVTPFVHKRKMVTVVVPIGEKIKAIREELIAIVDPHTRNLIDKGIISGNLTNISKNWLLHEQTKFREASLVQRHPNQGAIGTDFSICVSMYHAIELLERHGIRVFLNNFEENDDNKTKFIVSLNPNLRSLIEKLRKEVGANPFAFSDETMVNGKIAPMPKNLDFGHPKFEKAREFLLKHFENNVDSRVIVFCEYRESVMLMHRMLLQHKPLLNPRCFVGQGGTTGSLRAVTQKQQFQIMTEFRNGSCNILIATSIAEEGIDVGEVDLIICFDINSTNPTRFIQRIGRTGRKKDGSVIMLVTEGKEEAVLKDVLSNRGKINEKLIKNSTISSILYKHAPRLVPTEFNPKCVQTYVQDTDEKNLPLSENKVKKENLKVHKPLKGISKKGNQDVRNFFKKKVTRDPEDQILAEDCNQRSTQSQLKNSKCLNGIKERINGIDFTDIVPSTAQLQFTPVNVIDQKIVRKINKYLKSSILLSKCRGIEKALKSNEYSKETLRLMLDFDSNYVQQLYEKMEVIWALPEEIDVDNNSVPSNELQIREMYNLVEKVFGSKMELLRFLEKGTKTSCVCNKKKIYISLSMKYDPFFAAYQEDGYCQDSYDFISSEYQKITSQNGQLFSKDESEESIAESTIYDTMAENSFENLDFSIVESKYSSQWNFTTQKGISKHSTPRQIPENAFNRNMANKKSTSIKFSESPIVKAFARQKNKSNCNASNFLQVGENFNRQSNVWNTVVKAPTAEFDDDVVYLSSSKHPVLNNICNVDPISLVVDETNINEVEHFFDDDFDDIITQSLLDEAKSQHKPKDSDGSEMILVKDALALLSKSDSECHQSTSKSIDQFLPTKGKNKIETSKIGLDIVATNQNTISNERNDVTNPELEDFDLNDFLEPFSEEILDEAEEISTSKQNMSLPLDVLDISRKSLNTTPDIFVTNEIILQKMQTSKPTLAAKLASKLESTTTVPLKSPKKDWDTVEEDKEVSPSIFKRNINAMRSKLLSKLQRTDTESVISKDASDSISENIAPVKSKLAVKRKIIDSDDEEEEKHRTIVEDYNQFKNCEEIFPNSQESNRNSSFRYRFANRKKRRKRCEFIIDEAEVRGVDSTSEEETENYLDSVVVPDDDSEDDSSTFDMHAQYLQSIRSPIQRGAFKIPKQKIFNDRSLIFSQIEPPASSQYELDSFVVNEEEASKHKNENQSMCPLERAEKILKQRKRAKRNSKYLGSSIMSPPHKRQKKTTIRICNSSDDDFE